MTREELKERNLAIAGEIATLTARRAELAVSEAAWRSQSQEACNFTLKSKQQECLADKVWKKGRADAILAEMQTISGRIDILQREAAANISTMNSMDHQAELDAQAELELAGKGIDADTSAIMAEATAATRANDDKIKLVAAQNAQAIAANQAAGEETRKKMIYGLIALIILALIILFAIRHFKHK